MSLNIEFLDKTGSTLYFILFNSNGLAFNKTVSMFSTYSDSNISNFAISMSELVTRAGYYYGSINDTSNIARGHYKAEIYKQAGGSPSKSADSLRGSGPVYWNGVRGVPNIDAPAFEGPSNIGDVGLDDTLGFTLNLYDGFGFLSNADNAPRYQVFAASSGMPVSGSLTAVETGRYFGSFVATSGTFNYDTTYNIKVSGYVSNIPVSTNKTFNIKSPVLLEASLTADVDVLGQLGYATGVITNAISTSVFEVSIPSEVNDAFNGQIIRLTNGPMKSMARIIFDFDTVSSPKRITTNKAFPMLPTGNISFIVYPIGGELNVSS